MTALIIEDEIPAGKRLEKLLVQKGFSVLQIVYSIKGAVQWFAANDPPDFVFMDVRLRDGLCFAIFDQVDVTSKIVFTTAFDEFALQAFEYNSVAYLLKPIEVSKLDKLLTKIDLLATTNNRLYRQLECRIESPYTHSFLIPLGNTIKKLACKDIVCFSSVANATFAVSVLNKSYSLRQSLEKLEAVLDPDIFFRISRKHIVHRNAIADIAQDGSLRLVVSQIPDDFTVSRQRSKAFLDWYKK